ncbi:MAG: hypothetical protein KAI47_07720 [Deltaproteobacteria bacterium]|nr:hypothetical protein [Deltaproteobacteria bacterium]
MMWDNRQDRVFRDGQGQHGSKLRLGTRGAAFALAILWGVGALSGVAHADRTQLLKVNLRSGHKTRIDKTGPKSAADRELDALLDNSTGKSFSTAALDKIERAVRSYLRAAHPRAMPRLLLFLYPGRMTASRLKDLHEVLIDIDLIVDPCGRTVCKDSVAKHLEIIGKAIRQAEIRTKDYLIRFQNVTIRTATSIGGTQYDIYSFRADQVVAAGKRGGGGALVRRVQSAAAAYGRQMAKAVARKLRVYRVRLAKTPRVTRQAGLAQVALELRSDRVRYQSHLLGALLGTMQVLRTNKLTPESVKISVVAFIQRRHGTARRFHCSGRAVLQVLDGKLKKSALWSSYVNEERKDARQLSFSAADTRGGASTPDSSPDRSGQILASKMSLLAPCLQQEATRHRRFRGVTLLFSVTGDGRATRVRTKEPTGAKLQRCLKAALRQIPFQRHRGAPRPISYPMIIRR